MHTPGWAARGPQTPGVSATPCSRGMWERDHGWEGGRAGGALWTNGKRQSPHLLLPFSPSSFLTVPTTGTSPCKATRVTLGLRGQCWVPQCYTHAQTHARMYTHSITLMFQNISQQQSSHKQLEHSQNLFSFYGWGEFYFALHMVANMANTK